MLGYQRDKSPSMLAALIINKILFNGLKKYIQSYQQTMCTVIIMKAL